MISLLFYCRHNKFALIIRLLTGIGQYSEMTFIFDALGKHGHFEMLIQQSMEKVTTGSTSTKTAYSLIADLFKTRSCIFGSFVPDLTSAH